jgi:putative ABC transport system permease protein
MLGMWRAAPLALRHYPGVLVAVTAAVALAAAAAASAPFVRAGIENASLRGQVRALSPLAAGLERRSIGPVATDVARRRRAVRFGRTHGFAAPVLTSRFPAEVTGSEGFVNVVVMARTNAVAHVPRLAGAGPGAWISSVVAKQFHLQPGDLLPLNAPENFVLGETPTAGTRFKVRVAGIYRALDSDLGNPYWANFTQDIRPPGVDAGLPPTFVLVPGATLVRLARQMKVPEVDDLFEYPTDPSNLTVAGAKRLQHRYRAAGGSSALGNALTIARLDVNEVSATIALLSACGLLISLVVAGAAGTFLVRRRDDEAHLLFARGEAPLAFGARTIVEALLPALLGTAGGLALALFTLDLFAPAGTIDAPTVRGGILAALAAAALSVLVIACAALGAFPRRHDRAHPLLRRLARIPWEAVPLVAAGVLLGLVLNGSGLAGGGGRSHPSLTVFLLPVLAAAGLAGLATRLARRGLRGRGSRAPVPVFLALRRLAAARGFLAAVVVTAAAAVAVFAYAATLSASLQRTAAEKAFVANGSDVQGFVDAHVHFLEQRLPFPAAVVRIDQRDAFAGDVPVDIVSGDPALLARVVSWGNWPDDPRPRLRELADAATVGGAIPVLAGPDTPSIDAVTYQGARMPVRIVARGPLPGSSAGRATLLVPEQALRQFARTHHVPDPGFAADGLVWAKGDPRTIEPLLARSSVRPVYLTTLDHVRDDASVVAGERSYTYLKAIGVAAVALALIALLLYLQARQRGQLVASALFRRMGLPAAADGLAVALEASAIVSAASALGVVVAVGVSALVVPHVDPLPQYAPSTALVFPWLTLFWVGAVAVAIAAVFSALAVWVARRSNVAEALRVA